MCLCSVIAIAVFLVEYTSFDKKKHVQDSVHDPRSTCSLCSRLKSEVDRMVAGEAGSLCSECLINSALLLDDASKNDENEVRFMHRLLIATHSKSCESGHCDEGLKNYIVETAALSPEQRLPILAIADSYDITSLIIDVLSRVPREHWELEDINNWIYANAKEGKYKDALNHPEVKRGNFAEAEYRLFTLNRIATSIELRPESDEIEKNLADLNSIRRHYVNSDYPYPQDELPLHPNVLGTMAKCHFLLGNYDDAFACLNKDVVLSRPSSYRELLRGMIHEKLGQMDAAKSCWLKGVQINEKGIVRDQLIKKLQLFDE